MGNINTNEKRLDDGLALGKKVELSDLASIFNY